MTDSAPHDHSIRAMTQQDGFRAVALQSTDTVRRALASQQAQGAIGRLYANLLTGAVLVRETMAPNMRVQAILKHHDKGSIVADSHPDGMTRGLVALGDASALELGEQTNLKMVRELPNGALHQGVIATTAEHGLSASLTTYMHRSEQVETAVGVGCDFDDDGRLTHAGGYLIQHMPDADHDILAAITAHLETLAPDDALLEQTDAQPRALLQRVLGDIEVDILQTNDVHFGCNCSHRRFLRSLGTLGHPDLESLVADDEPLEITCDYCAKEYRIATDQVRALM